MGIGVADVFVADSMLAGTRRDDRLGTHSDKLACNEWKYKIRPSRWGFGLRKDSPISAGAPAEKRELTSGRTQT
jgi:hypothetical protein